MSLSSWLALGTWRFKITSASSVQNRWWIKDEFHDLEKGRLRESTLVSSSKTMESNLGVGGWGEGYGNQGCLQTRTSLPTSTWWHDVPYRMCATHVIPRQNQEAPTIAWASQTNLVFMYLARIIFIHNFSRSFWICQPIFAIKALLWSSMSLSLKPPSLFGLHIDTHDLRHKWCWLSSEKPHQYFIIIESNREQIDFERR